MKNKFQESKDTLYWLCLVFGIIMVLMMLCEFIFPQAKIPFQITVAYPVLLASYVAVKEVIRWTQGEYAPKLGEIFVALWWGVLILMIITRFILGWLDLDKARFMIPGNMLSTCITVLGIYTGSEISKKLCSRKKQR